MHWKVIIFTVNKPQHMFIGPTLATYHFIRFENVWSIAYQNQHWPIPLQISHGWDTHTEIHAYLSSPCSSQMCDFMIIQDDLIPEHTVCLTGCVLLPPSSQHERPQLPAPQNLLSAAILLWLHKGCCCQTEREGRVPLQAAQTSVGKAAPASTA